MFSDGMRIHAREIWIFRNFWSSGGRGKGLDEILFVSNNRASAFHKPVLHKRHYQLKWKLELSELINLFFGTARHQFTQPRSRCMLSIFDKWPCFISSNQHWTVRAVLQIQIIDSITPACQVKKKATFLINNVGRKFKKNIFEEYYLSLANFIADLWIVGLRRNLQVSKCKH